MMLLAFLVAAAPAETPRAFIERVYAAYRTPNFSPLADPGRYFAPELTSAIRKDSSGGEVGYLDGDPLCDCQDYDKVVAQVRSLRQPTPRIANARVHVILGPREVRDLKLSLVRTPSGWRIADVTGTDGHSLLHELESSNARR